MHPRRVLVVEDNPDSRRTLCLLLQIWGYHVEQAEDSPDGLSKALNFLPTAAILDIGLPGGMDGYELARRLRLALGQRVCLIALTGYNRPEDRRQAFEAGFDHHLSKPADLDELARLLGCGQTLSPF